eukprot:scaffold14219_cov59-Phaeocystis_antarctica.AAC.2
MSVAAKSARKPSTMAAVSTVLMRCVSGRGTPKTSALMAAGGSTTPQSWADLATFAVTVAIIWTMKMTEMMTAATVPKQCRPTAKIDAPPASFCRRMVVAAST